LSQSGNCASVETSSSSSVSDFYFLLPQHLWLQGMVSHFPHPPSCHNTWRSCVSTLKMPSGRERDLCSGDEDLPQLPVVDDPLTLPPTVPPAGVTCWCCLLGAGPL
ncbi:hypothetical protein OTU49_008061, partial [Cherax quadricarinatus]